MTRMPGLLELGEREHVPVTTVAAVVAHLDALLVANGPAR